MRRHGTVIAISGLGALALLVCACEDKKPAPAAPSATVLPPPAPAPEPPPPPVAKKPERPENIDTKVTPERRQRIEAAIPESKGFLVETDLEDGLKKKKFDKEPPGVAAFESKAKGKWIVFGGPISNLTSSGFDLPITYAQAEGDSIGMSRKWFMVTFSDVKGYDSGKFKAGQTIVVAARYNGKKQASPGSELIELGQWQ
jgi:hypothetical protein